MKQLLSSLAFAALLIGHAAHGETTTATEKPRVQLDTTAGVLVFELSPARAPETIRNFLRLVDQGFYTDLIFHRVVRDFVVQGGGFDEKLGLREPPRTVVNESRGGLSNRRGTIAMARMADPDSADSQFFINLRYNSHLNGSRARPGYTVFGHVVQGMDIIDAIAAGPTATQGGMTDVPVKKVIIRSAHRL